MGAEGGRLLWGPVSRTLHNLLGGEPPRDLADAEARLRRLAHWAGFENYVYVGGATMAPKRGGHRIWLDEPLYLSNYPTDWMETYHAEDLGRIDPVLSASLTNHLPFVWEGERLRKMVAPTAQRFLSTAHDFGVVRGLSIPVFGPGGDFGLFAFLSNDGPEQFNRHIEAHADLLHVACLRFHPMFARLDPRREPPALTARETEIVQWTAVGKSTAEIAVILEVSDRTVNFHIYNAMRKLNCYAKTQLVAKAILLGLLDRPPG